MGGCATCCSISIILTLLAVGVTVANLENTLTTGKTTLSFASYYGDHMVLHQAPKRSTVWGTGTVGNKLTITLIGQHVKKVYNTVVKNGYYPTTTTPSGVWSVMLDGMPAGGPYSIIVEDDSGFEAISLRDVMFGDVWVCSGQSNMQFSMSQIMNASAEIASADNYPNIRVFFADLRYSAEPRTDLIAVREPWSRSSKSSVAYFSALCWLYGRHLHQTMGYPVGLVASVWGGTEVEAWSSPQVLASCGVTADQNKQNIRRRPLTKKWQELQRKIDGMYPGTDQHNNSVLWNAMIHPLLNMTITGAIWYQGEANMHKGVNTYNCTFPGMIQDWREHFHRGSAGQTSENFPFGFVQLDGNFQPPEGNIPTGFAEVRWHQTADYGYVPNSRMNNVFMAVAMDLPDFFSPYWPVHSRHKQPVASRLWRSALAVAYRRPVIFEGPVPFSLSLTPANNSAEVEFRPLDTVVEIRDTDGFEFCCAPSGDYCGSDDPRWLPATVLESHGSTVVLRLPSCSSDHFSGIRYAWQESPCDYLKCAVYDKKSQLPAPPFVHMLKASKIKHRFPVNV